MEVLSRAEQMRREALAIFNPPEDTTPWGNARVLINHLGSVFANQLVLFPSNAVGAVNQVIKNPPSFQRIQGVFSDALRTSQHMLTGKTSTERATEETT